MKTFKCKYCKSTNTRLAYDTVLKKWLRVCWNHLDNIALSAEPCDKEPGRPHFGFRSINSTFYSCLHCGRRLVDLKLG